MSDKLKKDSIEYRHANKLYLDDLLTKKVKQKNILKCLNDVYRDYPNYDYLWTINNDVKEENIVISVQKAKENLKAITAGASGLAISALMGIDLNGQSLISALSITAAGVVAFRIINKDNIDRSRLDRKEQKFLKKTLKIEEQKLTNTIEKYLESIFDYSEYYDKNKGDFILEITDIYFENEDYIEQKKEEGLFEKDFSLEGIIDFHDNMFMDRDEFNYVINELSDNKKAYSKIKKL